MFQLQYGSDQVDVKSDQQQQQLDGTFPAYQSRDGYLMQQQQQQQFLPPIHEQIQPAPVGSFPSSSTSTTTTTTTNSSSSASSNSASSPMATGNQKHEQSAEDGQQQQQQQLEFCPVCNDKVGGGIEGENTAKDHAIPNE